MLTLFQKALRDVALEEFRDVPEDPENIPDVPLPEFAVWEDRKTKTLYSTMRPECRMYFFASRDGRRAFLRSRHALGYRLEPAPDRPENTERS